jgi:hypothetical protein
MLTSKDLDEEASELSKLIYNKGTHLLIKQYYEKKIVDDKKSNIERYFLVHNAD